MTLDQLGNLGEFVGAIIVVITLIILIIQLRHTKSAVTTNSYLLSASLIYETFDNAANTVIAAAMAKSMDGEELSRVDEQVLMNYWRGFIRRAEAFHHLRNQNLISEERLHQFGVRFAHSANSVPMLKEAWNLDAPTMLDDFRQWAERYIQNASNA